MTERQVLYFRINLFGYQFYFGPRRMSQDSGKFFQRHRSATHNKKGKAFQLQKDREEMVLTGHSFFICWWSRANGFQPNVIPNKVTKFFVSPSVANILFEQNIQLL